MRPSNGVLATLLAVLIGCGGGSEQPGTGDAESEAAAEDVGPQSAPPPSGPVDQTLADRGERLFQNKGCIGCHTIGEGKLTGPDLQGVTERREYPWIIAMVTNPDSMLKNDDTARQLFAEYMTPMANMGVTRDEARALYEYLRAQRE